MIIKHHFYLGVLFLRLLTYAVLALTITLFIIGTKANNRVADSGAVYLGFGIFTLPLILFPFFAKRTLLKSARRADACIESLQKGEFLAHWVYEHDDLALYAATEYKLFHKALVLGDAVFSGLLTLCGVIIAFALTIDKQGAGKSATWALVCVAAGFLLFLLVYYPFKLWGLARKSKRESTPTEVYLARNCAYVSGKLYQWHTPHRRLKSAYLKPGTPPIIEIYLLYSMGGWYWLWFLLTISAGRYAYGSSQTSQRISTPVPPGKEHEAANVVNAILSPPPL